MNFNDYIEFEEHFSRRGERTLFYNGYKFSLHQHSRVNPNMEYWRCSVRRPIHCKGRIEVTKGTSMGRVTNPHHWHPPNYSRKAELRLGRRMAAAGELLPSSSSMQQQLGTAKSGTVELQDETPISLGTLFGDGVVGGGGGGGQLGPQFDAASEPPKVLTCWSSSGKQHIPPPLPQSTGFSSAAAICTTSASRLATAQTSFVPPISGCGGGQKRRLPIAQPTCSPATSAPHQQPGAIVPPRNQEKQFLNSSEADKRIHLISGIRRLIDRLFVESRCLLCDESVHFRKNRLGHFAAHHRAELQRIEKRVNEDMAGPMADGSGGHPTSVGASTPLRNIPIGLLMGVGQRGGATIAGATYESIATDRQQAAATCDNSSPTLWDYFEAKASGRWQTHHCQLCGEALKQQASFSNHVSALWQHLLQVHGISARMPTGIHTFVADEEEGDETGATTGAVGGAQQSTRITNSRGVGGTEIFSVPTGHPLHGSSQLQHLRQQQQNGQAARPIVEISISSAAESPAAKRRRSEGPQRGADTITTENSVYSTVMGGAGGLPEQFNFGVSGGSVTDMLLRSTAGANPTPITRTSCSEQYSDFDDDDLVLLREDGDEDDDAPVLVTPRSGAAVNATEGLFERVTCKGEEMGALLGREFKMEQEDVVATIASPNSAPTPTTATITESTAGPHADDNAGGGDYNADTNAAADCALANQLGAVALRREKPAGTAASTRASGSTLKALIMPTAPSTPSKVASSSSTAGSRAKNVRGDGTTDTTAISADGAGADGESGREGKKRDDYLSWDEFFMGCALLSAQRSKDPCTQVGATIANEENIIVSIGYNGMPIGCPDDEMPWGKTAADPLANKYLYVCHAEMNAILNKNIGSLRNATLYSTMFPCNECAKLIIQSRIRRVVYLADKPDKVEMLASRRLFTMAGVECSQFVPQRAQVVLNFAGPHPPESPQKKPHHGAPK